MKFEWDEEKEKKNIRKHGIDFSTAATVFFDDNRIERHDPKNSSLEEDRYVTIGLIGDRITVVSVAYTPRDEAVRIISAHFADRREEEAYYNGY